VVPRALHIVENASVPSDPRVWPECLAIRDAGWLVTVVSPAGVETDRASYERVEGVEIHRFEPHAGSSGALGYLAEYGGALRQITGIVRRLARTTTFDVVHAASPPDILLVTARSLRRRGAATIFDQHDLSPELYEAKFGRRGLLYGSLRVAEKLGYRLADVVISPNESFREVAIERGGKAPEDVFVVRNGPDPNVLRPVSPDSSLAHGAAHLIGYVGRMESQDGVLEALTALDALLDLRADWHAVFVGDGGIAPRARGVVRDGRLAPHVSFLGFVSEKDRIAEILSSCDVCISPEPKNRLNDASTLIKVAEYMAVERPVVAYDVRETAITAGGAALRVADSDGFARAISDLLDDPELRARMGREGRMRVESQLSWAHSVEQLLAAYDRALIASKGRRARSRRVTPESL
jgi:glycosyltransferase involved in cell wall biosynthesis